MPNKSSTAAATAAGAPAGALPAAVAAATAMPIRNLCAWRLTAITTLVLSIDADLVYWPTKATDPQH